MKYCPKCGTPVDYETQRFCANCGAPLSESTDTPIYPNADFAPAYPMKWHKFLIYFALIAGAIGNALVAVLTFSGVLYLMTSNGEVTADMVYSVFPGMKPVNMVYAAALLISAVWGVVTRQKLAKFKHEGPVFLNILYIASGVLSFVYVAAGSVIAGRNMFTVSIFSGLVTTIIIVICNYIYFGKRAELFKN